MNDRLLRFSLRANATFSAFCAAACIVAAGPLAAAFGVPGAAWLMALGVGLLLFAAGVLSLSLASTIPTGVAWGVVAADALWVIGTVPLLGLVPLTHAGFWVALGVADMVLVFAVLQSLGILRLRRAVVA